MFCLDKCSNNSEPAFTIAVKLRRKSKALRMGKNEFEYTIFLSSDVIVPSLFLAAN